MPKNRNCIGCLLLALAAMGDLFLPRSAAQDLLGDTISESAFRLELRPYLDLPSNRNDVISMTTRPGDARLYVTVQEGYVFAVNQTPQGTTTTQEFFNFTSSLNAAGRSMNGASGQQGLQSIAFHPDFNRASEPGYGKLYTTYLENRPGNTAGLNFLGNSVSGSGVTADGVLAEWTFDFDAQRVDSGSFRELFRVKMPKYDHPIKQARFNPWAIPGDDDYGLLYMTHGDSNEKPSVTDDPTRLDNALGKMIRINPLQSQSAPYTIPADNPFADSNDPTVLKEIYAYGFRNPHTYSFNPDEQGGVHILLGDIGRNNVEEVNLVVAGGNYGWTKREGTFVHLQNLDGPTAGYITGVADLPLDEATFGYTYPVAQYDHDAAVGQISSGNSIASGFVIRNGSDPNLHNQFVFGDLSRRTVNNVFHADFEAVLAAVTKLDPSDTARDEPTELTQAVVNSLRLSLDHDNNPATAPQMYDDFLDLLQASNSTNRTDLRFGEGAFGEMYISSKINGTIYLVTNSVPLAGDFDADRAVAGSDLLMWQRAFGSRANESPADGNRDDVVDALDQQIWAAHYGSQYAGATLAARAIPEPGGWTLAALALVVWRNRRRRSSQLSPR